MIKQNYQFVDLMGRPLEQNKKDGKSKEVNGEKRFCGHRFLLKQKLYGDKRCIYCGSWFHWTQDRAAEWSRKDNIDNMNLDSVLEPLHCGKAHCEDYHHRYKKHQIALAEEQDRMQQKKTMELFKYCKSSGLI